MNFITYDMFKCYGKCVVEAVQPRGEFLQSCLLQLRNIAELSVNVPSEPSQAGPSHPLEPA